MNKQSNLRRLACVLLAMILCLGCVMPVGAVDAAAEQTDNAAFGQWLEGAELSSELQMAWTNDRLDDNQMRLLVNTQTLHPQKTGWAELDNLLERMLQNASGTTYNKLWYMYDWLVKMVTYSWEGYYNTSASVASYNSVKGYNYLRNMTHDGLTKTIPDDMANRTYHILTEKKGVCYDYAIAFAVIARYIGIESYVHTGRFTFENTSLGSGHHGWSVLVLGGQNFIFDPQRDARNYEQNNYHDDYYFGIPYSRAHRYSSDSSCAARDDSMYPIDWGVTVNVIASRSGTVTGTGYQDLRSTVTLTAEPNEGRTFVGWYDEDTKLMSSEPSISWKATGDRTVYALFSGDQFCDIQENDWYKDVVLDAFGQGLVKGMTDITFEGDRNFDRAMAVTMLSRIDQSDVSAAPKSGFTDVPAGCWYEACVNWAFSNGVTEGKSATEFAPQDAITREEFIVMAVRYAESYQKRKLPSMDLDYTDAHKLTYYALEPAKKAQAMGLIKGDGSGNLKPLDPISRAEGTAILLRLTDFLEEYQEPDPAPEEQPDEPPEENPAGQPDQKPAEQPEQVPDQESAA